MNAQLFSGSGNANATGTAGGIAAVAAGCTVTYFTKRKAAKAAAALVPKGKRLPWMQLRCGRVFGRNRPTSIVDGHNARPKVPVVDDAHIVTTKVESTKIDVENTLGNFKRRMFRPYSQIFSSKAIDKITFMTVE